MTELFSSRCLVIVFLAALLSVTMPVGGAQAADLVAAKRSGQVGELPNGLLGLVDAGAPADVKQMVAAINAEREAKYRQIAAQTGSALQVVMARAGAQLTARTPAGQYFQDASGRWRKR